MKVLFVGCGDLGLRTIDQLSASADTVWQSVALRRSVTALPEGVALVQSDVRDTDALANLLAGDYFDVIVVTLTPDQVTDTGYVETYVAGALSLAKAIQNSGQTPGLVVWVSSTGVYGQQQGEWVDELSETHPSSFRGKRLLEAEQLIQGMEVNSVVVRFSGIYGPGRSRLIDRVRQGNIVSAMPEQWTNRIHADDCAGVLCHLLTRFANHQPLETLYLGTDDQSATAQEVQYWLAGKLGVDAGDVRDSSRKGDCQVELSPTELGQTGRRCSNRRLRDSGYVFRYPTYREGYQALLDGD